MGGELAAKVLQGDILAASRLMRGVEDEDPASLQVMEEIYLHTGRAQTVGVAGAPGAGKSSLIGCLIASFREIGKTIGVVAVDPSSPFTGGALLGDRIRMMRHGVDKDVFVRSLATRGWKGGLARATLDTVHVMDAMGKDTIFIEAVGSGQGEIDIALVSDTMLLILTPGMGDQVQMMKAGILEAADIFVVNKADREGADTLKLELEAMLDFQFGHSSGWRPSVLLTEATTARGILEVREAILKHNDYLKVNGELEKSRRKQSRKELAIAIESCLTSYLDRMDRDYLEKLVDNLVQRKLSPRSAALSIINASRDR